MIKIVITMQPGGSPEGEYLLGVAFISNEGTGTKARGDYHAAIALKRPKIWKEIDIVNFPRGRRNVWYLLKEILNKGLGQ